MEIEAQIRVARLRAVFERLAVALAITVVCAVAAAAAVAAGGNSEWVWAWLALVAALSALRLAGWAAYRRNPDLAGIVVWEAVAFGGALASGLLWGLGVAMLPAGDGLLGGVAGFVPMLLLAAMCAGAATAQAMHVPVALAFVITAVVPVAARFALGGGAWHLLVAGAVLLYGAVLCVVACRAGRRFDEAARQQMELVRRAEALDSTNAALRGEIENHRVTGESLRQAQRMEAIGQLTGGLAHDFNNVLAVIGGNLQLIGRRADGNPDIQRLVNAAERAAERAARLTASLLSFARAQSLRPEEVDLNDLVREFAPMLRRTLTGRMELELALSPGRLMTVADGAHFQAALMHLAINARDASPPGRRLTIATDRVDLAETVPGEAGSGPDATIHPGRFACIRVSDTGPGMAPDVAAKAFEPFFTTKGVGQGNGLGLSQVYGFARQSGGIARIEPAASGGVTVSILLPSPATPTLAEPPPTPPPADEVAAFAGRVLLVEDDMDVREVLQESLASSGWQVTQAADGAEARAVLEGDAPLDIVVTDVVMPGAVSGVQLARAAAKLRPELPVLLISGFPTATLEAQGADEKELNLMRKPFTHAELLARMRQARERKVRERVEPENLRAAGA